MSKRLSIKAGIILLLVGALAIIVAGVVYAVAQITRDLSGSYTIAKVQTAEDTLLLYSQITPVTADLTELAFGAGDIDSFGAFLPVPPIPFWAENGGGTPFELILRAIGLQVNGVPISGDSGDALTLLMRPAGGELLPAFQLIPLPVGGGPVALEAQLDFLASPAQLGLTTNDQITFTARFTAKVPEAGPNRDVDGDGVPDFIAGAPYASPGGVTRGGSAFVFSGADGSVLYQIDGSGTADQLGWSVAMAGDVDNDGAGDFIVGAPQFDDLAEFAAGPGKALVYSGVDGSLLYQMDGESVSNFFGGSVSGAGDVNNDGNDDFIVGASFATKAYVYSGADGSLLYQKDGTAGDFFGTSVSGAGDVNDDGNDDFIVGEKFAGPSNIGSAHVFSGADGGLLFQKSGDAANDNFGQTVSGAGDVNADGNDDFMAGAPSADPGGISVAGSAFVYSGADGSLLYRKDGNADTQKGMGRSLSGAGDVDGDGNDDFIIGAPRAFHGGLNSAGSAFVYSGADGSILYPKEGVSASENVGESVSGALDVNGDGLADFIVSATGADPGGITNAGSVTVYSGADGSVLHQKDGTSAFEGLGFSVD